MKIGIFGGTYNPVHLGHTALANYICNLGLVDEVWLMVSPQNPFKQDHQLLDEAVRYRLVTLAVRDFPRLRASDFEFRLPPPPHTPFPLPPPPPPHPPHPFTPLTRAPKRAKFPPRRNSADILAHYPVIVYPREMVSGERLMISDGDSDGDATNANPIFLPSAPLYPISSTAIRCALAAGDDVSPWLDPAVHDEIIRQGLYRQ